MIVVAAFIITAVFVGYQASQEPREKMSEGHTIVITINSLTNQEENKINSLSINDDFDKYKFA